MTDNRVALVTGANKGIGLEIARQLAQAGVSVIVGARDRGRGEAAVASLASAGPAATFLLLDLEDEATIAAAAAAIAERHGRLDILVNNAGIWDRADGAPSRTPLDAVRRMLEVNFVGTLAVTQAMLPLLLKSAAARVVNLSSALGSLAVNSDPASPFAASPQMGYGASKAALNMLTVQLATEFRGTPHVVTSVSPGFVKTDLTGGQGFLTPDQAARTPVKYALQGGDAIPGLFVKADGEIPW